MFRKIRLFPVFLLILAAGPLSSGLTAGELEADLLAILPRASDSVDCRTVFEPRFFNPDNLFEYIDGAADEYLSYGFKKVVTADYAVGPDSSSVTVEIYRMESPLLAFGIYAAERSPSEPPADVGAQGYRGSNVLIFHKGPYYVKITSFDFANDLGAVLLSIGSAMAGRIAGDLETPARLRCFPEENRVPYSERFIPAGFLGQSFLRNGYRCDYAVGEKTWQAFLVPCDSDSSCRDAFRQYRNFLISQDYRITEQDGGNSLTAEKQDFILSFVQGACFGGVLNIGDPDRGRSIAEEMKKRLAEP
jgi:hypothetical protein